MAVGPATSQVQARRDQADEHRWSDLQRPFQDTLGGEDALGSAKIKSGTSDMFQSPSEDILDFITDQYGL